MNKSLYFETLWAKGGRGIATFNGVALEVFSITNLLFCMFVYAITTNPHPLQYQGVYIILNYIAAVQAFIILAELMLRKVVKKSILQNTLYSHPILTGLLTTINVLVFGIVLPLPFIIYTDPEKIGNNMEYLLPVFLTIYFVFVCVGIITLYFIIWKTKKLNVVKYMTSTSKPVLSAGAILLLSAFATKNLVITVACITSILIAIASGEYVHSVCYAMKLDDLSADFFKRSPYELGFVKIRYRTQEIQPRNKKYLIYSGICTIIFLVVVPIIGIVFIRMLEISELTPILNPLWFIDFILIWYFLYKYYRSNKVRIKT